MKVCSWDIQPSLLSTAKRKRPRSDNSIDWHVTPASPPLLTGTTRAVYGQHEYLLRPGSSFVHPLQVVGNVIVSAGTTEVTAWKATEGPDTIQFRHELTHPLVDWHALDNRRLVGSLENGSIVIGQFGKPPTVVTSAPLDDAPGTIVATWARLESKKKNSAIRVTQFVLHEGALHAVTRVLNPQAQPTGSALTKTRLFAAQLTTIDSVSMINKGLHICSGDQQYVASLDETIEASQLLPLPSDTECCSLSSTFLALVTAQQVRIWDVKGWQKQVLSLPGKGPFRLSTTDKSVSLFYAATDGVVQQATLSISRTTTAPPSNKVQCSRRSTSLKSTRQQHDATTATTTQALHTYSVEALQEYCSPSLAATLKVPRKNGLVNGSKYKTRRTLKQAPTPPPDVSLLTRVQVTVQHAIRVLTRPSSALAERTAAATVLHTLRSELTCRCHFPLESFLHVLYGLERQTTYNPVDLGVYLDGSERHVMVLLRFVLLQAKTSTLLESKLLSSSYSRISEMRTKFKKASKDQDELLQLRGVLVKATLRRLLPLLLVRSYNPVFLQTAMEDTFDAEEALLLASVLADFCVLTTEATPEALYSSSQASAWLGLLARDMVMAKQDDTSFAPLERKLLQHKVQMEQLQDLRAAMHSGRVARSRNQHKVVHKKGPYDVVADYQIERLIIPVRKIVPTSEQTQNGIKKKLTYKNSAK